MSRIRHLQELYDELDLLYPDIYDYCRECGCCRACIFLLREEADRLVQKGVQVAEINGKLNCIDSFPRNEAGEIVRDDRYPLCVHYRNHKCSIHEIRPLTCRLYPITLMCGSKFVRLSLCKSCMYIEKMEEKKKRALITEMRKTIDSIEPNLLTHILRTENEVAKIRKRTYVAAHELRKFELKDIEVKRLKLNRRSSSLT